MRDYTTEELEWEYTNEYVKRAWKIWPLAFHDFAAFVAAYHNAPIKLIDARLTRLSNFSGPYDYLRDVAAVMSHRRDVQRIIDGFNAGSLPPPLLIHTHAHSLWVLSGNTRLAVASAIPGDIECKIMEVK